MNKKNILKLIFLFFFSTIHLFPQEAWKWVNGYSSNELENGGVRSIKNEKVYYYWQLQSLKRAISPRYIKIIDIESYRENNKLLNRGILFTYFGLRNNKVSLCGNFSAWRCKPMHKNKYGTFFIIIPAKFVDENHQLQKVYQYKFKVDDVYDYDPTNLRRTDDGMGSYLSEFYLEEVDIEKHVTYKIFEAEGDYELGFRTVEFRIHRPEASTISIVGNFNNWNPEHDYLSKDSNGTFHLKKMLRPGEYLYNYIIDGNMELDTYNEETRYRTDTGELSSYLKIEIPGRQM